MTPDLRHVDTWLFDLDNTLYPPESEFMSLIERRNAFEFVRDHAAELFEVETGSAWRPRTGSMVNHRALTASAIDSREFIAARRHADAELLAPAGARIAFTGGTDCNDHEAIWAALDKVYAKHADIVLLHGGSPRGAERIAACWADNRKIAQVVVKPDWAREGRAAPVKRNDRLLEKILDDRAQVDDAIARYRAGQMGRLEPLSTK